MEMELSTEIGSFIASLEKLIAKLEADKARYLSITDEERQVIDVL